jgi:hypothetical protein
MPCQCIQLLTRLVVKGHWPVGVYAGVDQSDCVRISFRAFQSIIWELPHLGADPCVGHYSLRSRIEANPVPDSDCLSCVCAFSKRKYSVVPNEPLNSLFCGFIAHIGHGCEPAGSIALRPDRQRLPPRVPKELRQSARITPTRILFLA